MSWLADGTRLNVRERLSVPEMPEMPGSRGSPLEDGRAGGRETETPIREMQELQNLPGRLFDRDRT
ncbi:MAG: hypothetical protein KIT25_05945 [Enhydrobacter sp.]|nr:MAG: hypothetical protein KIT25_05945 [Enhydrobacter sp.]